MEYGWRLSALLLVNTLLVMDEEQQVQRVGRWLGWSAVLLLVVAVGGITLISMGVFDPPTVGEVETVFPLDRELTTQTEQVEWLDAAATQEAFTVKLAAAYTHGDQDSGYGLAFGSPEDYLVVAISPVGYATVFQVSSSEFRVPSSELPISQSLSLSSSPSPAPPSPLSPLPPPPSSPGSPGPTSAPVNNATSFSWKWWGSR
ncbi:MAG: hypothetical protein IPL78_22405 [Chloroflexi bacterium]|nr:hypothetical protein [Chloroflexota bacterium]